MNKFVLPAVGLLASLVTVQAQVFSPTNLVVMRLGGSGQTLVTSGNTMNMDQYTTAGTLVSSTKVPDSGTNALICGGLSVTEGYISLSEDGKSIVWSGYNTNQGSLGVALSTTTTTIVSRGVATLDAYANYTLQFAGAVESGTSIRGAVSDGSNNFWIEGGNTGIVYVGKNGPLATVSTSTLNNRCLHIFNNNLYYSTSSGIAPSPGLGFWEVPGLPTTAGGNNANAAGGALGAGSEEDFVLNTNAGIAYLCDDGASTSGGGIIRYTLTGGIWVSNYTLSTGTGGAYAVVADWSQAHPIVYATVGGSSVAAGNALVAFTDTGAASTSTVIASAPSGTAFRGLSWAPGAAPLITTQPASLTNDYGQSAVFSVISGGTPSLSYQWYSNSIANPTFVTVPGATSATLTLANLAAAQSNSMFYVIVSNAYGTAQSATATLTVDPPGPPINVTVTPASQTVNAQGTAVFNVTFAGATNSLSYSWKHNGTALGNGSLGASTISGATTASLTIANAFAVDDGSYTAVVVNSFSSGSNTTPGILAVSDPAILVGVVGATNFPNSGPVSLSVTAIGTSLSYQWLSNGVTISGANSSSYTVPNTTVSNTSFYSVVVTSTGGSVTNGPATVAFTPYLLYDTFSYPNGNLFGDLGSPWTDINGSNPELVTNGRVQVSQLQSTTDAQSLFDQTVNNTVVWASFTMNLTTLPTTPGGIYFANFEDTNFDFYGKIFVLTTNLAAATPDMAPIAYPGTYRVGIANLQPDSSSTNYSVTGPSAVVELDMAPGIDYHVVVFYDMAGGFCQMAVNPSTTESNQMSADYGTDGGTADSPNALTSGPAGDRFSEAGLPMAAYGLRQRANGGILQMDNLQVSYDWNGPFSGFAAVTAGTTITKATTGLLTPSFTNYSGNSNVLEVAASGIDLTYAWYQNNAPLSDGNSVKGSTTPALTLNPEVGSNSGNYTVVISNPAGAVTSSIVAVSIVTTPTAPSFTLPGALEPVADTTASEGNTVTFTATALGTGPITYQWYFNNGTNTVPAGSTTGTLTLTGIAPNQSGSYYVVATGGTSLTGTSSNAVLVVTAPQAVTIGYLRNLQNYSGAPTTITVSSSSLYTITGTVTTSDSITSSLTTSMYLQDSTGGLNLFITGDTTFRPAAGDIVTATGILEEYNNNLEIDVTSGADFQTYTDLGPSGSFPTAQLLPWGYVQANPASTTLNSNLLGSVVYMTNVYFTNYGVTAGVTNTFTNTDIYYGVTNNSGQTMIVFTGDGATGTNLNGVPIPALATTVTGILALYTTNYAIIITTTNDIVLPGGSAPPVSITNLSGAISGGGSGLTLQWTAVPNTASYSVLYSTNAAGPYTRKLATGLTFSTTSGTYTTTPTNSVNFYEVSSP